MPLKLFVQHFKNDAIKALIVRLTLFPKLVQLLNVDELLILWHMRQYIDFH